MRGRIYEITQRGHELLETLHACPECGQPCWPQEPVAGVRRVWMCDNEHCGVVAHDGADHIVREDQWDEIAREY